MNREFNLYKKQNTKVCRVVNRSIIIPFVHDKKGNVDLRDNAAKWTIKSFGQMFNPHIDFGKDARKALRNGIKKGRDRLKKFYDDQVDVGDWPRGLESRFRALGW